MIDLQKEIRDALPGELEAPAILSDAQGGLPSCFDVSGLCVASMGVACAEVAGLFGHGGDQSLHMDRALASRWFGMTIRPQGWELPPQWDDIAGLYRTADEGWIRLHTNAPQHRLAALRVLQCPGERVAVEDAVRGRAATELETAIVEEGGCAAQFRSLLDWQEHDQGKAVQRESLIAWTFLEKPEVSRRPARERLPLRGIRVLDCTRVLAGPVCTRFLAGYGADVLRIDPPGWREDNVVPEVTLGKRTATLNLRTREGRERFLELLRDADVFVHGYRTGALESLALGDGERRTANPLLIDVGLNAYGWTGPWRGRRGYDSLVQMSCGIAHAGMEKARSDKPEPLPVQALDHATGYLMAASVVRALRLREQTGTIASARLSLARTAMLLAATLGENPPPPLATESDADLMPQTEETDWGPARRLKFPLSNPELTPSWSIPAGELHKQEPRWLWSG